jgi:hypothetical protein
MKSEYEFSSQVVVPLEKAAGASAAHNAAAQAK